MTSWIDNISDIRPDYVEERQCNRRKTEVTRENYNAPPSERGRLDYNRLSAYDGRPRHRRLPYRLFLAAPAAKYCSVADVRDGGFFGSCLHQLPPRLLQCLAVRHCRRPTSATAISPERSCAPGTRRTDHITPVLQSLHWLPVQQRVTFKLATLVLWLSGRLAGRGRPGSRSAASMMLDIRRRRRHWETEHLSSPDSVSGTAFLLPSVIRHCRRQSSKSC